jgi:hypothetical protein
MKMLAQKNKTWQDALSQVRDLRDGLGCPVDEEIVETVAIIRLLGMNTTSSCGGHQLGKVGSGPCVTFGSAEARASIKEMQKSDDYIHNPAYEGIRDKAIKLTLIEMRKMLDLLEGFYATRSVPIKQRLIVKFLPPTYNILQCQGAELVYGADFEEAERLLSENRDEMEIFTAHLKDVYFNIL